MIAQEIWGSLSSWQRWGISFCLFTFGVNPCVVGSQSQLSSSRMLRPLSSCGLSKPGLLLSECSLKGWLPHVTVYYFKYRTPLDFDIWENHMQAALWQKHVLLSLECLVFCKHQSSEFSITYDVWSLGIVSVWMRNVPQDKTFDTWTPIDGAVWSEKAHSFSLLPVCSLCCTLAVEDVNFQFTLSVACLMLKMWPSSSLSVLHACRWRCDLPVPTKLVTCCHPCCSW